jgi:hypothetical protein
VELFQLSRKDMAEFLMSLKGSATTAPKRVLQEAWVSAHPKELNKGKTLPAFIDTQIPPIFEKLIKAEKNQVAFSLNEIVQLGNQIKFSHLSSTTVQNWVKRDVKELIGTPQHGKKYTIEQAATLFIVEDLKASLDFDSIRKILKLVFNNPADRSDDIVDPLHLYAAYASIFDKLQHHSCEGEGQPHKLRIEQKIQKAAAEQLHIFTELDDEQKEMVLNVMVTAALTVFSAYYQSLVKKYMTATLFLQDL